MPPVVPLPDQRVQMFCVCMGVYKSLNDKKLLTIIFYSNDFQTLASQLKGKICSQEFIVRFFLFFYKSHCYLSVPLRCKCVGICMCVHVCVCVYH